MAASVSAPTATADQGGVSKYTGVVALGLALMGAAALLMVIASLIAGMDLAESGMAFAIAIVVAVIGAVAVLRFGVAGKIVGLVAVLVILWQVFWIAFSITLPSSFADFSAGVMFVIGLVYAFGWGIAGLVRSKRSHAETTSGETRMVRGAVVAVLLAMVLSAALQVTSTTTVDASAAAGAVPVGQSDMRFSPLTYQVAAGEETALLVHNSDAFSHDFTIKELNVSEMLTPGSELIVRVTPEASEYQILCVIHPDMEATLTAK